MIVEAGVCFNLVLQSYFEMIFMISTVYIISCTIYSNNFQIVDVLS